MPKPAQARAVLDSHLAALELRILKVASDSEARLRDQIREYVRAIHEHIESLCLDNRFEQHLSGNAARPEGKQEAKAQLEADPAETARINCEDPMPSRQEAATARVVLLEFIRDTKEMYDAIRDYSKVAKRLQDQGVQVQPRWARAEGRSRARTRLVLVKGAEKGDFRKDGMRWHVAVSEGDEEAVNIALRSMNPRKRPKLKPNGRRYAESLMAVPVIGQTGDRMSAQDSDGDGELASASEDRSQEDEGEGADVEGSVPPIPPLPFPRQRFATSKTFIVTDWPEQPASASVRARSCPPQFCTCTESGRAAVADAPRA